MVCKVQTNIKWGGIWISFDITSAKLSCSKYDLVMVFYYRTTRQGAVLFIYTTFIYRNRTPWTLRRSNLARTVTIWCLNILRDNDEKFVQSCTKGGQPAEIQEGPVHESTIQKMCALTDLLRSMEGTVLKYGAVVIWPKSTWVEPFYKVTTAATVMSIMQKMA